MKLPKISVVIPSYNKAEFIGKTIDSIVDQKYPNLEVIIQDGGSKDGTLEIIQKYALRYPKIIKWESKKDSGQVDALEKGFKKVTGDIYAYINADDCYKDGALLCVGNYFIKHPKTLWLVGKGEVINTKGDNIWTLATNYKNFLLRKNKYHFLLMVNYLMQPSVFLSKETYLKYGPFNGTRNFVLEYEMWLRIAKEVMPRVINKTLSSFRLPEGSVSMKLFQKTLREDFKAVKNHTNDPIILSLHKLHNLGRVIMAYLTKSL